MLDHKEISWNETQDPAACNTNETIYKDYSRDPERTPYQWDSSVNAGFSTASKTWLPVHKNYKTLNLELQKQNNQSHYKIYKKLSELRQTETMINGEIKLHALSSSVLAYER